MRAYLANHPYREPYTCCNNCLYLHNDDYEGKCVGAYECNGKEDVSVYWGWNYEDAKGLERKRRRQSAVNDDDVSPTKKQRVIDLTKDDD